MTLDAQDIQGNVLAGFNTRFQLLLGLTVTQPTNLVTAARWIARLSERVTVLADVERERAAMVAGTQRPWLALAVSTRLIEAVYPGVVFRDPSLRRGLPLAATALGDRTDPRTWVVGSPGAPVDLFLVAASNQATDATSFADELVAAASAAGLVANYRELGTRLDQEREHFGFRDGISQPRIKDYDADGDVFAGNILFGLPRKAGSGAYMPAEDPVGLLPNGSLLVFRRLAQDVVAFRDFCATEATRLAASWPDITPSRLAALIVGRWPSGAVVSTDIGEDPGAPVPDNTFTFGDDLQGLRCPLGSHIRKVNPRRGNKDVVDLPRILRRGIPFGSTFEQEPAAERGLLFLSYQTSIVDQFEFLAKAWMNNPERPFPASGHDILVGRALTSRSLTITTPVGPIVVKGDGREWIIPTGGSYLFAPSRKAISLLGATDEIRRAKRVAISSRPRSQVRDARSHMTHDGITATRAVGGRVTLVAARWPLVRPWRAMDLASLRTLERLDFSGEHFPTERIESHEITSLASEDSISELALDGTALKGSELVELTSALPRLRALDVRGLDLDESDVRAIVARQPALADLAIGLTDTDRDGHRFEVPRLGAGAWDALSTMELRHLRFRGIQIDDRAVTRSPQVIGRLVSLDLGETSVGDDTARLLAAAPCLEQLAMDRTLLTDAGAVALSHSPRLSDLDMSHTRVRIDGVRALLARDGWERLRFAGLRIPSDACTAVQTATAVRVLDVRRTDLDDRAIAWLSSVHGLEELALDFTAVTSRGVAALAGPSLRRLTLRGVRLDGDAILTIAGMPRLAEAILNVGSEWLGLDALSASVVLYADSPSQVYLPVNLRELHLASAPSLALIEALSDARGLEYLSIPSGADLLASVGDDKFLALRTFYGERSGLDDVAMDRVASWQQLEALFVSGNVVGISIARLNAPMLHTLELRDTMIDDRAVEAIAALPRLHCLDIPATEITSGGVARLVTDALNLQSLAVDGRQMTPAVVDAIDQRAMSELYLYGTTVDDATMQHVGRLQQLRELNLVDTAITDDAVRHLVAMSGLRVLRGAVLSRDAVASLRDARPDLAID